MLADRALKNLVNLASQGSRIVTRNHEVDRIHPSIPLAETFHDLPLVTVRKTPWKKALREMEWFLSGDIKCPNELMDWWEHQLSPEDKLVWGYGHQLRHYSDSILKAFDQIEYLIARIRRSPNCRRLCLTTWNPGEMSYITLANVNSNTPANCHMSFVQFFVLGTSLYMKQYQRSCDILLGLPCNWVQHWALLTYIAHRTGYQVGGYTWLGGDAHVYTHESHQKVTKGILEVPGTALKERGLTPSLVYKPSSEEFKASDFSLDFEPQAPLVTGRPKLL